MNSALVPVGVAQEALIDRGTDQSPSSDASDAATREVDAADHSTFDLPSLDLDVEKEGLTGTVEALQIAASQGAAILSQNSELSIANAELHARIQTLEAEKNGLSIANAELASENAQRKLQIKGLHLTMKTLQEQIQKSTARESSYCAELKHQRVSLKRALAELEVKTAEANSGVMGLLKNTLGVKNTFKRPKHEA